LIRSAADIDADNAEATACVNAVEVVTQRSDTPVTAFFGRFIGLDDYDVSTGAVAYVGYAGELLQFEIDQPIAICKESLPWDYRDDEDREGFCNFGRLIPSNDGATYGETGAWTDFNWEDTPCEGGTSANLVRQQICSSGNQWSIPLKADLATIGGQLQSGFSDLVDCWLNQDCGNYCSGVDTEWFDEDGGVFDPDDYPAGTDPAKKGYTLQATSHWAMTLPVIDCSDGNPGPCNKVVGAMQINVPWMIDQAGDIDAKAPFEMEVGDLDDDGQDNDWAWTDDPPSIHELVENGGCATEQETQLDEMGNPMFDQYGNPILVGKKWEKDCRGIRRWNQFVRHFEIARQLEPDEEGNPVYAEYDDDPQITGWRQKTIYFMPNCQPAVPKGRTGGENFGVLARIPVLVD
jgi:hypothetical protein